MERLIQPDKTVLNILGKAEVFQTEYRMSDYCVSVVREKGILLFNVMTREMLLLTEEEWQQRFHNIYLKEFWFTVPQDFHEKECVELLRWTYSSLQPQNQPITNYTIFTTTDCNARCYYCYEKGCTKISMTEETADKTVDFIMNQSCGRNVRITWFGGEPLCNMDVIGRISKRLRENEVSFESVMVSNGYLFDEEMIKEAVNEWNLKGVQITLDGTEEVYNCSKSYIYKEDSAYQKVLSNIEKALASGIRVSLRMNLSLHNADNLLELIEELGTRFKNQHGLLNAYVHLILNEKKTLTDTYSRDELEKLYDTIRQAEEKIIRLGLSSRRKNEISRKLKMNQCMADCGNSVTITPDGHIGLCDHYIDSQLIGHIDGIEQDCRMKQSWRERREEIPECEHCFNYPQCIRLKKCPDYIECTDLEREYIRKKLEEAMDKEFLQFEQNLFQS